MDKRLVTAIAIVVTVAWAVSFIVGTINSSYQSPPTLQALMMIVAGAAFSGAVIPKKNGKEKNA